MTVVELGAALLWGVVVTVPLLLMYGSAKIKEIDGSTFAFFLGIALQVFCCVACYMAGRHA